jgi:[acyl-carrier-protein] S-malonyltransferase
MLDELPDGTERARLVDAAEAMTDTDLRTISRMADPEELAETRIAQPLLFLGDFVWGTALMDAGFDPAYVAGHSLGEFAALALAGVFSPEAGLQLVVERANLMATAAAAKPGGMLAVLGLDGDAVGEVLEDVEGAWLANDNCPGQVVVSGTGEGIDTAATVLEGAGARRIVRLAVSGAFHSPLMDDAADAFADTLAAADMSDARIPVVQNTRPETPALDAGDIRDALTRQMTSPVRWTETMQTLRGAGVETLVEAGPGTVLKGLARRVAGLEALSVDELGVDAVLEEVHA